MAVLAEAHQRKEKLDDYLRNTLMNLQREIDGLVNPCLAEKERRLVSCRAEWNTALKSVNQRLTKRQEAARRIHSAKMEDIEKRRSKTPSNEKGKQSLLDVITTNDFIRTSLILIGQATEVDADKDFRVEFGIDFKTAGSLRLAQAMGVVGWLRTLMAIRAKFGPAMAMVDLALTSPYNEMKTYSEFFIRNFTDIDVEQATKSAGPSIGEIVKSGASEHHKKRIRQFLEAQYFNEPDYGKVAPSRTEMLQMVAEIGNKARAQLDATIDEKEYLKLKDEATKERDDAIQSATNDSDAETKALNLSFGGVADEINSHSAIEILSVEGKARLSALESNLANREALLRADWKAKEKARNGAKS